MHSYVCSEDITAVTAPWDDRSATSRLARQKLGAVSFGKIVSTRLQQKAPESIHQHVSGYQRSIDVLRLRYDLVVIGLHASDAAEMPSL